MRVLRKYADVYGPTTIAVRLTTTCLLAGTWYWPYKALHMELRHRGGPIHVHALSGGCYYLYRFMKSYPEHRERVMSQVYDSPSNVDCLPSVMQLTYGFRVPHLVRAIPDAVEVSRLWLDDPLFDPSIPTGIVTSRRDQVMCADELRAMISAWGIKPGMLVTDSMHVQSLRDYPAKYASFCIAVRAKGAAVAWPE